MARSDLLLSLVRSSTTGNKQLIRSSVEAIIAEERAKQHHVLADRLAKVLTSFIQERNGNGNREALNYKTKVQDFFNEKIPEWRLEDLVLQPETKEVILEFIEEHRRVDLLRSFGLEPRHTAVLMGPPGNGKTTLAECVAESLGLPFFVIRYESVIGSYLGETAARLRKIFEYLRTFACVVFFDEFDVVGKERGDENETGEIKRVVSSLLMQMDDLPSHTIIFAATNHPELLDRGVWRRFDLKLCLPSPTQKSVEEYLKQLCERSKFKLPLNGREISKRMGKVSYAEVEQFYLNLLRRTVLQGQDKISRKTLDEQLTTFKKMKKAGAARSNAE